MLKNHLNGLLDIQISDSEEESEGQTQQRVHEFPLFKKTDGKFQSRRLERGFFLQEKQNESEYFVPGKRESISKKDQTFVHQKEVNRKAIEEKENLYKDQKRVQFNNRLNLKKMLSIQDSSDSQNQDYDEFRNISSKKKKSQDQITEINDKIDDSQGIKGNNCSISLPPEVDKLHFVASRLKSQEKLCTILTYCTSLMDYIMPKCDLRILTEKTHLISCQKKIGSLSSNYYFSISENDIKKDENFVGKIREKGNLCYHIFQKNQKQKEQNTEIVGTVNLHKSNGPRRIQLYILKQGYALEDLEGCYQNTNFYELFNIKENEQKILKFSSRKPNYNKIEGRYKMNFNGRVHEKSKCNFILENQQTSEQVLMFGKCSKNEYRLDVSHPLSPMIGFACAMSILDGSK